MRGGVDRRSSIDATFTPLLCQALLEGLKEPPQQYAVTQELELLLQQSGVFALAEMGAVSCLACRPPLNLGDSAQQVLQQALRVLLDWRCSRLQRARDSLLVGPEEGCQVPQGQASWVCLGCRGVLVQAAGCRGCLCSLDGALNRREGREDVIINLELHSDSVRKWSKKG